MSVLQKKLSEGNLSFLLDAIEESVIVVDIDTVVRYLNGAAKRLYGYSEEEAKGSFLRDLIVPEAVSAEAARIMEKLQRGESWTGEFRVRDKSGRMFSVEITDTPIFDDDDGNLIGIIGVSRDLTEKRGIERKRISAERLADKAGEMAGVGSWKIFPKEKRIFWNHITRRIHGVCDNFSPDFENTVDFFEGESRERIIAAVSDAMERGIKYDIELPLRRFDGEERWIRTIGWPEYEGSSIVALVGTVQDITEHKKRENELLESRQMLRSVFDNVHMLVVSIGRDSRIIYVNDYFLSKAGYKREDVIGKNFIELFVFEHEIEIVREVLERSLNNGDFPSHFTNGIRTSDGRKLDIHWSNTVFIDEAQGTVENVTSLGEDITERLKTQRSLLESEERFRTILDKSAEAIFLHSLDGSIVMCNEHSWRSLGYTEDELRVLKVQDIDPNITVENHPSKYWLKMSIGDSVLIETLHRRKDGGTFPVEVNLTKIMLNDREHIIGSARDISQRKAAEQSIKESEAKYRILFENAPDSIYMHDMRGVFVDGNRMAEKLIGFSREELIGKKFSDTGIMPLKHMPKALKILGKNAMGRSTGPDEFELVRKDGTRVTTEITTFPVLIGGRKYVIGIVRDISYRKEAEKKIERERQYYRSFLDSLSDWAWEMDLDGIHTYSNPAIKKILGYDVGDVVGFSAVELWPVELQIENQVEVFLKSLKKGEGWRDYPAHFVHKNGERRILESTAIPIFDDEGNLKGYRGIDRDITDKIKAQNEKDRLEKQLRQSQKLETLGTLAGGIAHDFNNLLTPILGYSEIAMMDIEESSPIKDQISQIKKGAEKARNLVRQLLLFSRKVEEKKVPVDLGEILRDSLKLSRATIPTTIDIELQLPEEALVVLADSGQISQIVLNMATNACNAMGDVGCFTVGLSRANETPDMLGLDQGEYALLSFRDTGKGISKDRLDRVFEPFFTTREQGTGLGLSVVHGIVKAHGGGITVTSEEGFGTVFEVYIPLTESRKETDIEKEDILLKGSGRILIVDDVSANRRLFRSLIEKLGYAVDTAENGLAALKAIDEVDYDLVISDITMPEMTGTELAANMKDIPIILMTGFIESVDVKGYEVLTKPIALRDLSKAIDRHIKK